MEADTLIHTKPTQTLHHSVPNVNTATASHAFWAAASKLWNILPSSL